jgi:hypothetical protein
MVLVEEALIGVRDPSYALVTEPKKARLILW